MKRGDDVLYLTLVDFFIQAFFFVLVILVLREVDRTKSLREVEDLKARASVAEDFRAAGISSPEQAAELMNSLAKLKEIAQVETVAELPDKLTTMVPAESAAQARYIRETGGLARAEKLMKAADAKGGIDLPSCVMEVVDGKATRKLVASFRAVEKEIFLDAWQPEFVEVMVSVGAGQPSAGMAWSPQAFVGTFSAIHRVHPACRYFVRLDKSRTEFRAPQDAVGSVFYTAGR